MLHRMNRSKAVFPLYCCGSDCSSLLSQEDNEQRDLAIRYLRGRNLSRPICSRFGDSKELNLNLFGKKKMIDMNLVKVGLL